MEDVKYHLYLSYHEQSQLLKALIYLKNEILTQEKYAEPVDELFYKKSLYYFFSSILFG